MPGSQASNSPVDSGHRHTELDGWPTQPVRYFALLSAALQRGGYQVHLMGEDSKTGKTKCGSHHRDVPVPWLQPWAVSL